jgi:hypothetical protein
MNFVEAVEQARYYKKKIRRKCWHTSELHLYWDSTGRFDYLSWSSSIVENATRFTPDNGMILADDWELYEPKLCLKDLKPGDKFRIIKCSENGIFNPNDIFTLIHTNSLAICKYIYTINHTLCGTNDEGVVVEKVNS